MILESKDKYILVLLTLLFIVLIAIPRLNFPDFDHGDEYSDASMMMSGKNFIKFGFIKCRFLPIFDPHLAQPSHAYTHAPPMADITNGLLRKIFRTDSLRFFRVVSLVFSLLSFLFWYLFVRKFSNSLMIGILAALFYFTNPFFIYGSDSLYESAYTDCLRGMIFYLFLWVLISSRARKAGLIAIFILFSFVAAFTFEYLPSLVLFMVALRYFYVSSGQKIRLKYIFMLSLAPLIMFALHFLQNCWYLGSFNLAYKDLSSIAVERIVNSKDSPFGAVNFGNWWNYVFLRYTSLAFIFDFYILSPFALLFFMLYQGLALENKNKVRRIFFLCLLLFACGISWYILFPSHALAHTFVLFLPRHLVPAASLTFALCCYIAYHFVRVQNRKNVFGKVAVVILIISIILAGLLKSELPITKDRISQAKDFLVFKQCLLSIRASAQDEGVLGVNYYRYPFMRYYTDRQCRVVFNKTDLENLPSLPEYFVFIPYDTPPSRDLLSGLKERYDMLFQCKSARFPAIFLKLKGSGKS